MDNKLMIKIENLFIELGFSRTYLNKKITYVKGNEYIRVDYIKSFESYVLEYATGIEEAQNNLFEDGDLFPIKKGNEFILNEIKNEIKKLISDKVKELE